MKGTDTMNTTKVLPYQIAPRESYDEAKRRIAHAESMRVARTEIATMKLPAHALDSRDQYIRIIDHLLASLRGMYGHAMAILLYKEDGLDHPAAVKRGYTSNVVDDLECSIIHLEARRMAVLRDDTLS